MQDYKYKYYLFLLFLIGVMGYAAAQTTIYSNPVSSRSLPDPTLVRGEDGAFYLFATEDTRNVPIMKSMNLVDWTQVGTAFTDLTRPNFVANGGIWAPDISLINGKYVLFYSMSTWGGEWECGIGRAVADNPWGPFTDLGKLFISSEMGVQNSIDQFYIEDNGIKYLIWGSFRGIYSMELTEDGLNRKPRTENKQLLGTAFEGIYIHKKGNYYYAFASVGSCCAGVNSTYQTVVGRSENLLGPYVNKAGRLMLDNHYEVVISKNSRFVGTGHNSEIVTDDMGQDWMLYHAIDLQNPQGRKLVMDQIKWDENDWPYVEGGTPSLTYNAPVLNPPSTANLAGFQKLRGEVLSSPAEDEYTVHKYNAFDTNEGTNFKAKDLNGWVGLDLKSKLLIKKVRIMPLTDRTERLNRSIIQGANDAQFTNPVNLFMIPSAPTAGIYSVYNLASEQEFQFVRIISPNQYCNLAEIEFYCEEGKQVVEFPQLTNIPTIYLETKGGFDFVDKSIYTPAQIVITDGDSIGIFKAEVRGRGNSTWEFMEKKPFRIKFDKKQHFLGFPANAKSWTLIACAVDKTLLRNSLAFEMSRKLGFEFSPSNKIVDVVLDGFYYGSFMASDHLQIDTMRINVTEMKSTDIGDPEITGGYHLEIDAYANEEPVNFRTNANVPITIKDPDEVTIVPMQFEYIKNHVNFAENFILNNPEGAFQQCADIQSVVKYYLHSELTGNCDSYWSIHTSKKRGDDKLYFGPVWDYDQAFMTNNRVPRYSATLDQQHGVSQHWFRSMMKSPSAQQVLKQIWNQSKAEGLSDYLLDYLYENADLIQQSQALNFERWRSINKKVWFEDALFPTYKEYIDFVAQFIEDRFAWFEDNYMLEKKIILPISAPENPIRVWSYTFDNQPENWYSTSFDYGTWPMGDAPFGYERNLQNTIWRTTQIYIRTRFFVEKQDLDSIKKTFFYLFHDEDVWIYLNGELALMRGGYIADYQSFEFEKSLLKEGWNTLAVKCTQTGGGQLIDVGIFGSSIPTSTENIRENSKYNYFVKDGILNVNSKVIINSVSLFGIEGRLIQNINSTDANIQIKLPHRGIFLVRIDDETVKIIN